MKPPKVVFVCQECGSQAPKWMSHSRVRLALVGSVTCLPVSLKASQESMVPKARRPAAARSRRRRSRKSHSSFVAQK